MKKISLRIRFTLMASFFLLISCTVLTLLSNVSAEKIVNASTIVPSMSDKMPLYEINPSHSSNVSLYHNFQKESIIAAVVIIISGSMGAYWASGYVLKPVHELADDMKKQKANQLNTRINSSQGVDELQELTNSYNQMLTEMQRSFAIQKQFSADAAHELRTPLAIMQTKLDVFALSNDINEETKKFLDGLNEQVERLTSLIEDLLWFSKDLPIDDLKDVRLFPLISDVVDELNELASDKQITIRISGDTIIKGQDRLLERVFYNLIENAIKYSPAQSTVTLNISSDTVTIMDEGEGIPDEYRQLVFEPFYRIDKSRSREIGGNGLGLAVCRKILDRHHAQIEIETNHPKGSIFIITFSA